MSFINQLFGHQQPQRRQSPENSPSASKLSAASLYPPNNLLPKNLQKLSPFSTNEAYENNPPPSSSRQYQEQTENAAKEAEWMAALPLFGQEKRYRPSEAWAAISPNLPNMADVFPQRYQQGNGEAGNENNNNHNNNRSASSRTGSGHFFEHFDNNNNDEDFYNNKKKFRSGSANNNNNNNGFGSSPSSRSRTVDSIHNNNNNNNNDQLQQQIPTSSIDYFSQNFHGDQEQLLRSPSAVSTAAAASGMRSFVAGHDFENNPFASTQTRNASAREKLIRSASSGKNVGRRFMASRGAVGDGDERNNNNINKNSPASPFAPLAPKGTDDADIDDLMLDGNPAEYLEEENIWLKNKLLSYGSTANPQSQRLFERLAPDKLSKERDQMKSEALAKEATRYQQKTKLRAANNLLPPTPFSYKVPVLKGSMPNWIRRCDPALDLEARVEGTNKLAVSNRRKKHASRVDASDNTEGDDSSDADSDDEAIFDEFLLNEIEQAKHEKPRSEKRGDFYRLNLLMDDGNSTFKLHDAPPIQQKDPNQTALEFLAVSRPEFAPALRRLAPWQLQLIDWSSLFRGGTHQDVSVTAKRFPHGAPWEASPFSEAPVASGGLGFVGNLQKREKETAFFSKLHGSNDGRVSDGTMGGWMKKCPIRFNARDDLRKDDE